MFNQNHFKFVFIFHLMPIIVQIWFLGVSSVILNEVNTKCKWILVVLHETSLTIEPVKCDLMEVIMVCEKKSICFNER